MNAILSLANDHLHFDLLADASFVVLDKKTGTTWRSHAVTWQDKDLIANDVVWNRKERYWADYFIARFKAERVAEGTARISMFGPPWTDVWHSFTAKWSLEGRSLVFAAEAIDEALQCLNFPPAIQCASVVLPDGVGRWIREDQPSMTCDFSTQNNGLNMRWAGGLDAGAQAGWLMIFEEGYADAGIYRSNLSVTPCWLKSKGAWGPRRSVRYAFTEGGYVGLAKRFKSWAKDHRIYRTLAEKMEQTPELKHLLGGRIVSLFMSSTHHIENMENFFRPIAAEDRARNEKVEVNFTYREARKAMDLAKAWGMKKGVFNLRGVFAGGYDERHPDIWPPEPALGTVADLRSLVAAGGPEHVVVLHDNYQDIYTRSPSFPDGVIKDPRGRLFWGGHWHGGLCYILCSKEQERYARRNWPHLADLGLRGHFIDTASCVQFYQCYDPAHPMVRGEDGPAKMGLMKFFKDQGLVLGSEEAADYGTYWIDFLENRNTHTVRQSPPIWPLVFHDAAFFARYPSGGTSGGTPAAIRENLLWGYMAYHPAHSPAAWPGAEREFKESLVVDEFHARVGTDEMLSHAYLCEDEMVEQTVFSSGAAVYANYADEPRQVDGVTVPAQGWKIAD